MSLDIPRVPDDPKISPLAVRAMVTMIVTFAVVAVFANVQRLRRDKMESVTVTPIATPSPSPVAAQ
jgi:hypothetical protein